MVDAVLSQPIENQPSNAAGTEAETTVIASAESLNDENTCCQKATCCYPTLREVNVTSPVLPFCDLIKWSSLFWFTTNAAVVLLFWAILYFLLGSTAAPGGAIFGLLLLILFSYVLGWSLTYVPYLNLPPVFGMLVAGIIIGNTVFNIQEEIGLKSMAAIRSVCVTFIMMRAGLQLTTTALRQHPIFILVLALIPCTVEMIVVTIASRFLLGYPWNWAWLNGTIISCMSPVVTVNCILALADRGYGEDKGMASLLCAAVSIDDVHIISMFSIAYSYVTIKDKLETAWWSHIPGEVRDILLGITAGIILGTFVVFFPHRNHKHAMRYRLIILVFGSLMCTAAAGTLGVTGGGYLATVFISFIATTGWRCITSRKFDVTPLRKAAAFLWHFMQPILVGVIGADIDIKQWNLSRFGLYLCCIIIGLLARSFCAVLSTFNMPFNFKERIFVALSWLPKGTVQAALAPIAYETALKKDNEEELKVAKDIVTIAVLSILLMAPIGAITMMVTGPLLLNKLSAEETQQRENLSLLHLQTLQPINRLPGIIGITSHVNEQHV